MFCPELWDLQLGFGLIARCVLWGCLGHERQQECLAGSWAVLGLFDLAGAGCFVTPNVKEEGESVRELQLSGFLMGDSFKTLYRQKKRVFSLFSFNIHRTALPGL